MNARIDQLLQLTTVTHDGDLISKSERDELVKEGLATRSRGYNFITADGIELLVILKLWPLKRLGKPEVVEDKPERTLSSSAVLPSRRIRASLSINGDICGEGDILFNGFTINHPFPISSSDFFCINVIHEISEPVPHIQV